MVFVAGCMVVERKGASSYAVYIFHPATYIGLCGTYQVDIVHVEGCIWRVLVCVLVVSMFVCGCGLCVMWCMCGRVVCRYVSSVCVTGHLCVSVCYVSTGSTRSG